MTDDEIKAGRAHAVSVKWWNSRHPGAVALTKALDHIEAQAALLKRCRALSEKWSLTEHDIHRPVLRRPAFAYGSDLAALLNDLPPETT